MHEQIQQIGRADVEDAPFVVCQPLVYGEPPSRLHKEFGECAECGIRIYWASSAPVRPLKICSRCAVIKISNEEVRWTSRG